MKCQNETVTIELKNGTCLHIAQRQIHRLMDVCERDADVLVK